MINGNLLRLFVLCLFLAFVSGCGEGPSNTNGVLALTAESEQIAPGLYQVRATASYSVAGAASLANAPIQLSINVNGDNFINTYYTDATGTVGPIPRNVGQSNQAIVVTVTAQIGDLIQVRTVTVPAQ